MTVLFESVYPIRRGLELDLESRTDEGVCEAGSGGWREPNLAEALGLVTDGVRAELSSREEDSALPGVPSAPGAVNVQLAPLGAGDAAALGEHPHRTSFYGVQTDTGVLRVVGVGADEGGAYAEFGVSGTDYCVRPLRDGYVQPLDPAGVCMTPDCAETIEIPAESGGADDIDGFCVAVGFWRADGDGGGAVFCECSGACERAGGCGAGCRGLFGRGGADGGACSAGCAFGGGCCPV